MADGLKQPVFGFDRGATPDTSCLTIGHFDAAGELTIAAVLYGSDAVAVHDFISAEVAHADRLARDLDKSNEYLIKFGLMPYTPTLADHKARRGG